MLNYEPELGQELALGSAPKHPIEEALWDDYVGSVGINVVKGLEIDPNDFIPLSEAAAKQRAAK